MKSIMPDGDKFCAACGSRCNLERHHIFFGAANRKLSEEDGLTVMLCAEHHRGNTGVHGGNRRLDLDLKAAAQYMYMSHYGKTLDEFIQRYGKNYMD